MTTAFEQLSNTSKVWIYQAEREFTESELAFIQSSLQKFSAEWDSHGAGLKNSYKIENNRFIVIAVDEQVNHASGCSIDKSVNLMKMISDQTGLNLLSKTNIAFINENGNIDIFDFKNTGKLLEAGVLKPDTLIFNNLINSKEEFDLHWKKSLNETWLKKYIK